MTQRNTEEVVEGNLPLGRRPAPGPRSHRPLWTGEREEYIEGQEQSTPWTAEMPVVTPSRQHIATASSVRQGAATRNVATADGRRTKRRLMGVDAARGFALLGMVAVHTLPATANENYDPTLVWTMFAGHSAALFALLAGVSLAFITGGRHPLEGLAGRRARWSIAVRALLLFVIGLLLNFMDFPAYNILMYYGLMFLLAIPFTLLKVRWLFVSAAVFALGAPFLMQASLDVLPAHVTTDADIFDLVQQPVVVLAQLFLTGTYPALPWMSFICLGMALGRLPLNRDRIQILLVIVGAVLAAVARGLSLFLLVRMGLADTLVERTPWMTSKDVMLTQIYGPDPQLPTTSWLWLLISGPHTNTPFALATSAGLAMVALGLFLLVSRVIGRWLAPLAAVGSMTLTLYAAHLTFLAFVDVTSTPWFWYFIQIATVALFATAWQQALGAGPLERLVTRLSKGAAATLVRAPRPSSSNH